jgi:hypothetical protein
MTSRPESGLAFISKEQSKYFIAYYDAFMRAYMGGVNSTLSMSDITDETSAWHHSEEKQQFHFKCETKDCDAETDILGRYGFCPRCGKTNARKLFSSSSNGRPQHGEVSAAKRFRCRLFHRGTWSNWWPISIGLKGGKHHVDMVLDPGFGIAMDHREVRTSVKVRLFTTAAAGIALRKSKLCVEN